MNKLIYLYVKESPLGLKYLGQTTQNPIIYIGSGIYWKRHIKKNKFTYKDIKTTILFETTDRQLLKEKGIYYSKLWNIVESEEWANLCYEAGESNTLGYKMPREVVEKIQKWRKVNKVVISEDGRRRISEFVSKMKKSEKQIESVRNVWKNKKIPDYIKKAAFDAHAIKILHTPTGIVYPSKEEVCIKFNVSRNTLRTLLTRNIHKSDFRYVDDNLHKKSIERTINMLSKSHRFPKKTGSSKYPGVRWNKEKRKWYSSIRLDGKRKHIGYFKVEEDARDAYNKALEDYKNELKTKLEKNARANSIGKGEL